jgi:hypothetical protein
MRRAFVSVVLAGLALAFAGPVAAKGRGVHFTVKLTGASISATESVFKAHDSYFGSGAGVSSMTVNAAGNAGTDSETTYYGDATAKSRGRFTILQPNSQGVAPLTGAGHDVGGTGRARHLRSSYTYRGTINVKTGVYTFTLTGTYYF